MKLKIFCAFGEQENYKMRNGKQGQKNCSFN